MAKAKITVTAQEQGVQNVLRAVSDLEKRLKQVEAALKSYDVAMKSTASTVSRVDAEVRKSHNSWLKHIATVASGIIVYQGIRSAMRGVIGLIAGGVKAVSDYQDAVIGMAAMYTTLAKDQSDIAKTYQLNVEYAKQLIPVLEKIDIYSSMNLDELLQMNQALSTQGVALNTNNQAQIQGYTNISNAIKFMTKGMATSRQISQEIKALINGQAKATDSLGKLLQSKIGPEYAKQIAQWKKMGELQGDSGFILEKIGELLSGFTPAAKDMENTWSAVVSSLKTTLNILARESMTDVLADWVKYIKEFNNYLREHKEEIAGKVKQAWNTLKGVILAVYENFDKVKVVLAIIIGAEILSKLIIFVRWWSSLIVTLREVQATMLTLAMVTNSSFLSMSASAVGFSATVLGIVPAILAVGAAGYWAGEKLAEMWRKKDASGKPIFSKALGGGKSQAQANWEYENTKKGLNPDGTLKTPKLPSVPKIPTPQPMQAPVDLSGYTSEKGAGAAEKLAEKEKQLAEERARALDSVERLIGRENYVTKAHQQYESGMQTLNDAMSKGAIGSDMYQKGIIVIGEVMRKALNEPIDKIIAKENDFTKAIATFGEGLEIIQLYSEEFGKTGPAADKVRQAIRALTTDLSESFLKPYDDIIQKYQKANDALSEYTDTFTEIAKIYKEQLDAADERTAKIKQELSDSADALAKYNTQSTLYQEAMEKHRLLEKKSEIELKVVTTLKTASELKQKQAVEAATTALNKNLKEQNLGTIAVNRDATAQAELAEKIGNVITKSKEAKTQFGELADALEQVFGIDAEGLKGMYEGIRNIQDLYKKKAAEEKAAEEAGGGEVTSITKDVIKAGAQVGQYLGQMIGGQVGKSISSAASGALAGLTIGGPVGAAIGGVIGLVSSFLGGDDEEKAARDDARRSGYNQMIENAISGGQYSYNLLNAAGWGYESVANYKTPTAIAGKSAGRRLLEDRGEEGMVDLTTFLNIMDSATAAIAAFREADLTGTLRDIGIRYEYSIRQAQELGATQDDLATLERGRLLEVTAAVTGLTGSSVSSMIASAISSAESGGASAGASFAETFVNSTKQGMAASAISSLVEDMVMPAVESMMAPMAKMMAETGTVDAGAISAMAAQAQSIAESISPAIDALHTAFVEQDLFGSAAANFTGAVQSMLGVSESTLSSALSSAMDTAASGGGNAGRLFADNFTESVMQGLINSRISEAVTGMLSTALAPAMSAITSALSSTDFSSDDLSAAVSAAQDAAEGVMPLVDDIYSALRRSGLFGTSNGANAAAAAERIATEAAATQADKDAAAAAANLTATTTALSSAQSDAAREAEAAAEAARQARETLLTSLSGLEEYRRNLFATIDDGYTSLGAKASVVDILVSQAINGNYETRLSAIQDLPSSAGSLISTARNYMTDPLEYSEFVADISQSLRDVTDEGVTLTDVVTELQALKLGLIEVLKNEGGTIDDIKRYVRDIAENME